MKHYAVLALAAALLAATPSFAGDKPATHPGTMLAQLRPLPGGAKLVLYVCAQGFNKTLNNPDTYTCTTPYIKCPPSNKKRWYVTIKALPVVDDSQGVRFAYRCSYYLMPN